MIDELQHSLDIEELQTEQGEQEQNQSVAHTQMNVDSYKYYLEKINKALEQSNLLTNSFFQDQNNFSYGEGENEFQQVSDKQYIQELEQKSQEYQQFYGIQDPKNPQPLLINGHHKEFNSESQQEQNRFDMLSQEISNRIQERAQATIPTEASNQFDLHTIEEEDIIHEEDLSTEKKNRQKQSDQLEDQSLSTSNQHNHISIDMNKEDDELNDHQYANIQNNHIMQIDELNEEFEQRQKPPSPILQDREPFQYNQYYQQQQNLLQQQQLQYQQQIQQYQQLQQQYQQNNHQKQFQHQQNIQKQTQYQQYQQNNQQQQQIHSNQQSQNQQYIQNQQKQQQIQQEKNFQQKQQQILLEQQQNKLEQQYLQKQQENLQLEQQQIQQEQIQNQQDALQNQPQQQVITIKGNRYHLQNIEFQQQSSTEYNNQSPQINQNSINNDKFQIEDKQEIDEQEDDEFQQELTTQQEILEKFTFKQNNMKQEEIELSNQYDIENNRQQLNKCVIEDPKSMNTNKNIMNNKKYGNKHLSLQDQNVRGNGNYYSNNSLKTEELNQQKISTNSQQKGISSQKGNSSQTSQIKKKINNYVLPSQQNVVTAENRKNVISPQYKNNQRQNEMNQYYLQDSLNNQQFIQSPSSREYQSLNTQNQTQQMRLMYQQQNVNSKQEQQQNNKYQEHQEYRSQNSYKSNKDINKYISLNQLQQEKLKIEKVKYHKIIQEQKDEKEKNLLRQNRQNKEFTQNSHSHISTQSSKQNDYFPTYPKTNQNNSNIYQNSKNNSSINNSGCYDDNNKSQQSFHNLKKKQLSLSNLNTQNSINQLQNNLTKDSQKYQQHSPYSPHTKRSNIRSPQRMINKDQIIESNYGKIETKNKQIPQEKNQSPVDFNAIKKITDDLAKQQALKVQQTSIDQNVQRQAKMLIQNGQVADAINKMVLYSDKSSRSSHSRTPSKTRNTHTSKISNQKIKEQDMQRFKHAIVVHSDNLKPKKAVKQQKDVNNQYFASYFNESPIKKQQTPNKLSKKEQQSDRGILSILENYSKNQQSINGFRKEGNPNSSQQSLTSRNQNLNKQSQNNSQNNVQLKTLIL